MTLKSRTFFSTVHLFRIVVEIVHTMGKRTVVSLFSGAGGLDYGFEAAGYDCRVSMDLDADCCETLRASGFNVLEGDIVTTTTRKILRHAGLRRGELDVLIGGPPCQPFSKSGFWRSDGRRGLADPRADTLAAYMRVVK